MFPFAFLTYFSAPSGDGGAAVGAWVLSMSKTIDAEQVKTYQGRLKTLPLEGDEGVRGGSVLEGKLEPRHSGSDLLKLPSRHGRSSVGSSLAGRCSTSSVCVSCHLETYTLTRVMVAVTGKSDFFALTVIVTSASSLAALFRDTCTSSVDIVDDGRWER